MRTDAAVFSGRLLGRIGKGCDLVRVRVNRFPAAPYPCPAPQAPPGGLHRFTGTGEWEWSQVLRRAQGDQPLLAAGRSCM